MQKRKHSYRKVDETLKIPAKANWILNIILVGMLLILLRVWHLAVVQYDEKLDESRRPQRKQITEPAKRATIRDRFNIPLALNKMQYNVAILYSQIKHIPTVAWDDDASGKRVKRFKRKEYIAALSALLAKELQMDEERIEDLIHAKASFYNQIPFSLKEDISEEQYYRLKMLEKDWLGIHVQRVPKRHYVFGKVASDIIGYMGAINGNEYESIIREIKALETLVEADEFGETISFPSGMETLEQVRRRLKGLRELAYTVNDSIGKTGIEGRHEKTLRGFRGKKSFYADAKGNFLHELPGAREPLAGKRVLLTISAELQAYAEQLLIQNENVRQTYFSHLNTIKHTVLADKEPWIKGGAIVAIDPKNGEILTMASHPRLDPNDFIPSGDIEKRKNKLHQVRKWLESESYLAGIWNQDYPLEREVFEKKQGIYNEEMWLTWPCFLDCVLSKASPLKNTVLHSAKMVDAITVQNNVEGLLNLFPHMNAYRLFNLLYREDDLQFHGKKLTLQEIDLFEKTAIIHSNEIQKFKQELEPYFEKLNRVYDRVLFVDFMRLALSAERMNDDLLDFFQNQSLEEYKEISVAILKLANLVKQMARELFHDLDFYTWRKQNEKEYLKKIRAEEKAAHKYAKPYLDYLDTLEEEQFQTFWKHNQWQFVRVFVLGKSNTEFYENALLPYIEHFGSWHEEVSHGAHQSNEWLSDYFKLQKMIAQLPNEIADAYMNSCRGFLDLDRHLLGSYRYLRKNEDQKQQEKHLAAAFYPRYGYGYGRSQAYRQSATQGSLFKLITAYEALVQRYKSLENKEVSIHELNPLTMVDSVFYKGKDLYLGYDVNHQPLPRFYKGGRLPKSSSKTIGTVDLLKAIETSSNPYFALLAGDVLESPHDLAKAARLFSFGQLTGIDLPYEIPGQVPDDLATNRTGLYACAIGQHTLVVTPLQTSVMLSAIANGGKILKPKIVQMLVGKEPEYEYDFGDDCSFLFEEILENIGIDFPVFLNPLKQSKSLITHIPSETLRVVFLPEVIQRILLDGMCRVVAKSQGEGLKSLTRIYQSAPEAIKDYTDLKNQLLGKTSTSESVENIDLDSSVGTNMYTHVWFGGIVYNQDVIDPKEHCFLFRDSFGEPELVVVVYLRYGGFGKEAGPVAAQMAKKWKEIKQKFNELY